MDTRYAERMGELVASEIREILAWTSKPGVISFAGGLPAAELFPVAELAEVTRDVLADEGARALQYSTTEGDPDLRARIAERMNATRSTRVQADEIGMTSGSQQGLDMTAKVFLDRGDAVLCESPTYIGALGAFRVFSPRFVEVPTDDEGLVIAELERRLEEHPRAKLIYVIPDFQNPTGRTWSLERRLSFMAVVRRSDAVVIEDAPYAELRFEGQHLPALKSLDTTGQVIYLGTFSKILSPGLRLAWLAADPEHLRRYTLIKQSTDLHTSTLAQAQVRLYLERHGLDRDVRRIREAYGQRRDIMLRSLERCLPAGVSFTRPEGGMFLWVELPAGCDSRELLRRCIERRVAFVPGGSFFPGGGGEHTFRLNFSAMPPARIVEGIERLAAALAEYLAAGPGPGADRGPGAAAFA